jgi:epoxyqueuosine reductase
MAQLTSGVIKSLAKDLGADIVGIASVDRFEGAPQGHGPLDLMPESRSVIVAGIRIPDPVVEYDRYHMKMEDLSPDITTDASIENFYMLMGHYTIDIMLNTLAVKLANKLETSWGLRALPTPNTIKTGLGKPALGAWMGFFSQRHAATRAGLGEFGFSGLVLTPEFGPRVRFVSVITEAELEPDPLVSEKICMRGQCGGKDGPKCHQRCTDGALQLRDGIDPNAIFIDIPSSTERSLCLERVGDTAVFSCVFVGTCMRVCPTGMKVTKRRQAE